MQHKPPRHAASCRRRNKAMGWAPVACAPRLSAQGDAMLAARRSLPEEVPVALVFDGTTLAVMMASPTDIEDFALGFALGEGVITHPGQISGFEVAEHAQGIEARFWLSADRAQALAARRRFMAGPVGCGLCGIDSLDQAIRPLPVVAETGVRFVRAEIMLATECLRAFQPLHDQTRGTHAAGFLKQGQGIVIAREDVGRHNALDKLFGALVRSGEDPASGACVMTSRVSVELVQKCAMLGCPVLVAVSAPTAHAVRLAQAAGVTVAAFARSGSFDLYSHSHRVLPGEAHVA